MAGAGQITSAKLGRQTALLDLQRRRSVYGGVNPLHTRLEPKLNYCGTNARMDHVQQPIELRFIGVDVPAKPLQAFRTVKDLSMRIKVVCILAAWQVGQGDWRRLVLGVDTQKLIDIPPPRVQRAGQASDRRRRVSARCRTGDSGRPCRARAKLVVHVPGAR